MCTVLAYLLNNKVEESWLMIVENAPQKEKLTLFLDYYFQQLMESQNVPIEMWNIEHRQWTSSAAESWNAELNCII
jgi:hypothetical protein